MANIFRVLRVSQPIKQFKMYNVTACNIHFNRNDKSLKFIQSPSSVITNPQNFFYNIFCIPTLFDYVKINNTDDKNNSFITGCYMRKTIFYPIIC